MDEQIEARRAWMGLLARAPGGALPRLWDATGLRPEFDWLRPPEFGGVMVRGRAGGTGAAFNLGEMTVTRCSLRLATSAEGGVGAEGGAEAPAGHACVQGRDRRKAEIAALCDALMQTGAAAEIRAGVLDPLAAELEATAAARAAKAAATKVDFFTMVRGE